MPRVPPEIKAAFPLEQTIQIRSLQMELERFSCNKIRNLAIRAKEANQLETSKLYYKAWAVRMLNLRKLQKQEREEQKLLVKETKKLSATTSKKAKANLSRNPNTSFITTSSNLLRQVC
jgi:hypothetical protein